MNHKSGFCLLYGGIKTNKYCTKIVTKNQETLGVPSCGDPFLPLYQLESPLTHFTILVSFGPDSISGS